MKTNLISGEDYIAMVRQGSARLNARRKVINDLNVFPIPDGDTGDNMYMTISSGCSNAEPGALSSAAASVARGMLLGARGNSGVILSRIFAGIAKGLEGCEQADTELFAQAMHSGVKEAYNAVSTPVEGTILTVIRESVAKAEGSSFEDYFRTLVTEMHESLNRTPELLEVLREARVVDSGGAGMLCIAEGMLDAIIAIQKGDRSALLGDGTQTSAPAQTPAPSKCNLDDFGPDSTLEFGYCTEFLLRLQTAKVGDTNTFDESVIRDWLNANGESVVCFRDGSIVKVHVHTMDPGSILTKAREWGEFLTLKIENMTLQHSEVTIQDNFSSASDEDEFRTAPKPYGTVAVASGRGLVQSFKDAGVDEVIEGGQTMNPSAVAFLDAFDKVRAQTIFVFPNNSNIIMTAQQAASIFKEKHPDREVVVFATKNVGAGYVAAASMDFSCGNTEEIIAATNAQIEGVVAGHVSRAIRDSHMDGLDVREGEWIGISGGKILASSPVRGALAIDLADKIGLGSHDVALVFVGDGVPASESELFASVLQNKFPRTEIIMTDGGQPVFDYIIVLC